MTVPLDESVSTVEVEGWVEKDGVWYEPEYLAWLEEIQSKGFTI